jgi:iron uptake system EfeUOB component EfeO/EfeM
VTEYAKKWVDKIYDLHPSIKPKKANELTKDHDQMIDNIKQWIEKYSKNISYEMGQELSQIIH